jgi:hypothetical protein
LDDSIADRTSSAQDWLAYGRFLDTAGFPARLAYACFVKSARLEDSLAEGSERKVLADASTTAEKRAGAEASAIRRDPEPFLRQALALRR